MVVSVRVGWRRQLGIQVVLVQLQDGWRAVDRLQRRKKGEDREEDSGVEHFGG